MQDGALPHFAKLVRAWLDETFSGRWIGCRGSKDWPPRSSDMTPLDFYLWAQSHDKQLVYRERSLNIEDLKPRITVAVERINNDKQLLSSVQCNLQSVDMFPLFFLLVY